MTEIIKFPKNKQIITATLAESDLQWIITRSIKTAFYHGRSQGFMIGILVANVTNFIIQFVFKH